MKKLLVIAVALASVNAFATRARVNALGNSVHLIDTNTVHSNPADMFFVGGDYVTAEAGVGSSAAGIGSGDVTQVGPPANTARDGQNNAEGMVVRSWGDAKAGLSIGHMSTLATSLRNLAGATVAQGGLNALPSRGSFLQQNPVGLFYGMKAGDLAWAAGLNYSNFASKTGINEKETSMGLVAGMRMGAMDARLGLGLGNTYQNDIDGKFEGTSGITGAFGYWLDTTYLSANLTTAGFKTSSTTGVDTGKYQSTSYGVSATNSLKKDGSEFFYGAGLQSTEAKITQGPAPTAEKTTTTLNVPVTLGLEVDATTWLVLRGSVTQSIPLLGSAKTSTSTSTSSETGPGSTNTAFAAGAGLKFNKITLDGTMLAGGSQTYGTNALLGQVGLTYMF
ncbi:MAG: hypothetical protein H7061_06640 [Bdellovibrionaceae bacterium]|nr:hypothetical protein [Bdellovibrio sp.]